MNIASFGKTVENLKRIAFGLCKFRKGNGYIRFFTKNSKTIDIDKNLNAVLIRKEILTFDKSSYIGQVVLNLS